MIEKSEVSLRFGISHLPAGFYFCHISGFDKVMIKQLVKII